MVDGIRPASGRRRACGSWPRHGLINQRHWAQLISWPRPSHIEQETIRAVVLAYAKGDFELPRPKTAPHRVKGWRLAPSFRLTPVKDFDFCETKIKPYNAESIGKFLGWMQPSGQVSQRVYNALAVLEAAEEMEAERRLGKMLASMGGKGSHGGNRKSSDMMSLEEMHIGRKQSSRW